jgi:ABC-type transporter Mla subunit MlaD
VLRDVVPAAAPLRDVLRQLAATLPRLRPVLRQLRGQLPDTRASLSGFARLAAPAARALGSLQVALTAAAPIIRGLRIYGADFVLGVTNGLAGIITSNYNRVGHYGRLNFVENPQTLLAGIPASILSKQALVPGLLSTRTGVTALCPGGNQPPAPDGSNRVVVDRSLCDPSQSIPASVNGG